MKKQKRQTRIIIINKITLNDVYLHHLFFVFFSKIYCYCSLFIVGLIFPLSFTLHVTFDCLLLYVYRKACVSFSTMHSNIFAGISSFSLFFFIIFSFRQFLSKRAETNKFSPEMERKTMKGKHIDLIATERVFSRLSDRHKRFYCPFWQYDEFYLYISIDISTEKQHTHNNIYHLLHNFVLRVASTRMLNKLEQMKNDCKRYICSILFLTSHCYAMGYAQQHFHSNVCNS